MGNQKIKMKRQVRSGAVRKIDLMLSAAGVKQVRLGHRHLKKVGKSQSSNLEVLIIGFYIKGSTILLTTHSHPMPQIK